MAILPIINALNPLLKKPSVNVEVIDDSIKKILDDMMDTMRYSQGIGLSAIQIGIPLKLITVEIKDVNLNKTTLQLINAEIVKKSEELSSYEEGCLSFPSVSADIERPKDITVRYQDRYGQIQELVCSGLLATCLQHEIDHTNGIVFVDYLSRLRRDIAMRKLSKYLK